MANTATNINQLIANYSDGFNDKELLRLSNDGAYRLFLDDAARIPRGGGIISPADLSNVIEGAYSPNGVGIPILKNAVNSTTIVNSPLYKIIPINPDKGIYMIAYTDNKGAKILKKYIKQCKNIDLYEPDIKLFRNLKKKFKNKKIVLKNKTFKTYKKYKESINDINFRYK